MKVKNLIKGLFFSAIIILSSCKKDNPDPTPDPDPVIPTTYAFAHQGTSTVSYGGQTARLIMASEMMSALASSTTTEADLLAMWMNDGWTWTSDDANASTKNIGGKTARR